METLSEGCLTCNPRQYTQLSYSFNLLAGGLILSWTDCVLLWCTETDLLLCSWDLLLNPRKTLLSVVRKDMVLQRNICFKNESVQIQTERYLGYFVFPFQYKCCM